MLFVGEAKEIAGAQVAIAARVANKMAESNEQDEIMTVGVQQLQEWRYERSSIAPWKSRKGNNLCILNHWSSCRVKLSIPVLHLRSRSQDAA